MVIIIKCIKIIEENIKFNKSVSNIRITLKKISWQIYIYNMIMTIL